MFPSTTIKIEKNENTNTFSSNNDLKQSCENEMDENDENDENDEDNTYTNNNNNENITTVEYEETIRDNIVNTCDMTDEHNVNDDEDKNNEENKEDEDKENELDDEIEDVTKQILADRSLTKEVFDLSDVCN
jgi:hypothetical protein